MNRINTRLVVLFLFISPIVWSQGDSDSVEETPLISVQLGSRQLIYEREIPDALKAPNEFYMIKLKRKIPMNLIDSLSTFKYLKSLSLSNRDLSRVDLRLPEENLTKLVLYRNNLSKIPETVFNLPNLENLSVGGNLIESISRKISKLENLKILNLESNFLDSLPPEIADLERLEFLSVGSNSFLDFPNKTARNKNLETLRLQTAFYYDTLRTSNGLIKTKRIKALTLGRHIGNFPNLRTIFIIGYPELYLSNSIAELRNLEHLSIQVSELPEGLPENIFSVNTLESLTLYHTPLVNLQKLRPPERILSMKELNFTACELKEVPDFIKYFPNLEKLTLAENEIDEIPIFLQDLKKLKRLNLLKTKVTKDQVDRLKEKLPDLKVYY